QKRQELVALIRGRRAPARQLLFVEAQRAAQDVLHGAFVLDAARRACVRGQGPVVVADGLEIRIVFARDALVRFRCGQVLVIVGSQRLFALRRIDAIAFALAGITL